MRIIPAVVVGLLLLAFPALSSGQTNVDIHGSGGPTLYNRGSSVAVGVGFTPTSWLTVVVDVERTHQPSRLSTEHGVTSAFRGGTLTSVAGGIRASLFGPDRIGPYALAGLAVGVSRPNVNDLWPKRVAHQVQGPFVGGGFQVPIGNRISLFADGRVMLMAGKQADVLLGVAPIRAGMTWRF